MLTLTAGICWKFTMLILLGFPQYSPFGTAVNLVSSLSCFFFFPKKLLSVCLLREMFAYLVPVHLDVLSTQLCFGFGRFIVIIAV